MSLVFIEMIEFALHPKNYCSNNIDIS
jgi:hypothetical protein